MDKSKVKKAIGQGRLVVDLLLQQGFPEYIDSQKLLVNIAHARLNNELVEPKDDNLTEAYMAGFQKGKDSVKVMGVGEIIKMIESICIFMDTNQIIKIAHALSGKVGKEVV